MKTFTYRIALTLVLAGALNPAFVSSATAATLSPTLTHNLTAKTDTQAFDQATHADAKTRPLGGTGTYALLLVGLLIMERVSQRRGR